VLISDVHLTANPILRTQLGKNHCRQRAGHGKIASMNPTATVSIVNGGEGSGPDRRWWVIPKGVFLISQRLLYPIHQHQEIPSEDPRVRGCHLSYRSGRIAHHRIDNRSNFTPQDNRYHHPADHCHWLWTQRKNHTVGSWIQSEDARRTSKSRE